MLQAGYRGEWFTTERTWNKRSETSQEDWLTRHGYSSIWTTIWLVHLHYINLTCLFKNICYFIYMQHFFKLNFDRFVNWTLSIIWLSQYSNMKNHFQMPPEVFESMLSKP